MAVVELCSGYFVTAQGRVFSKWRKGRHFKRGPIFSPRECAYTLMSNGYITVSINGKVRYLHQLVLEAYRGPRPPGYESCHGNGDRADNRLSNLRWDTVSGNQGDRNAHGTSNKGARNGHAKFSAVQVRKIRNQFSFGATVPKLARKFGCHVETIRDIVKKKTWKAP